MKTYLCLAWITLAGALALPSCETHECLSNHHPPCGDQTIVTQDAAQAVQAMNGTGQAATGEVDPETGVNWYTYTATAGVFEHVDPEIYLHSPAALHVCVYMTCGFAGCPPGTEAQKSPNGFDGCCDEGTNLHFQMQGCSNETAQVWMSVESLHPTQCDSCVSYELDYNW